MIATNLVRPGLILLGSLIVPEAGEEKAGVRLTFNRDIAPIIFQNCSPCHRPGGAGPFDLLSYSDVRKRGNFLVAVTQSRYMPPWQPEPGFGKFIGERRLSDKQIGMLRQWVDEASVEGNPADLPPVPDWPTGWFLGEPDLEVVMPRPYTLPAESTKEGSDLFRTFVLPLPVESTRYVRALELRPGNPRVVHHIVGGLDPTTRSRQRDEQDLVPGFEGMRSTQVARPPGGHVLVWTPGKVPRESAEGMNWGLREGTDLVLEFHMQPSGKAELVQPSVGLYFSDEAPTRTPFILILGSITIDIPAGAKNHWIEDSYVLPVDVDALGLYPHAHFLGKEIEVYALLPDGTRRWLLYINDWDFNWQDDYLYSESISLPRGTRVVLRCRYDNSAANKYNPNNPPRRVLYGPNSSDEMGEVWIQMLTQNKADRVKLQSDYRLKQIDLSIGSFQHTLLRNPNDAQTHQKLGRTFYAQGKMGAAIPHYRQALRLQPSNAESHAYLAAALVQQGNLEEALRHYSLALEIKPTFVEAHLHAANLLMRSGDYTASEQHYASVIQLNASDAFARLMRALALVRLDRYQEATTLLEETLRLFPANIDVAHALARLLSASPDDTVRNSRLALKLLQTVFTASQGNIAFEHVETLAMALAESRQFDRAVDVQQGMIQEVTQAGRQDLAELLRDNLRLYREGQPCRKPWRDDDPVFSPHLGELAPPGSSSTPVPGSMRPTAP